MIKNDILKLLTNSIATLIMLASLSLHAAQSAEKINVHGFVSQGYVYSPENPYGGFDSLKGTFEFREAALNGSWQASDNLKVQGQVMYRELDDADLGASLDFFFLDYSIASDPNSNYGMRLGRIKNEIGLYNSVRDIPGARPGITIPIGYLDSLRDMMISSDGLAFYGYQRLEFGTVNYNFYAGQRDFNSAARSLSDLPRVIG